MIMTIHEKSSMETNLKERERIGLRVAELRKMRGMTQEELANLCDVNRVNIAKIEGGVYNVSIDILSKVAFALGYVVDVKVNESVVPIHFSKRRAVNLVIGESYYVSFGGHEAQRCKLLGVDERGQITIEIVSARGSSTHCLFADEIGASPEEAVLNQVTF